MTDSKAGKIALRVVYGIAAVAVLVALLPSGKPQNQTPPATQTSTPSAGAPAPAPEPAPRTPRLIVRSTPPGASLLVNGRMMGATPLTLDSVPAGSYGLRLEKEGCRPATLNVNVDSSDAVVEQQLEPAL
ncbi:MAG TPA: PEGA domain-containing protein, partial [Planctomycetota bacterium]|nr:PEGA domain-containing protein [Planctomycetota bacterium]